MTHNRNSGVTHDIGVHAMLSYDHQLAEPSGERK